MFYFAERFAAVSLSMQMKAFSKKFFQILKFLPVMKLTCVIKPSIVNRISYVILLICPKNFVLLSNHTKTC